MTIFPNINKLKTLLTIRKKIDTKKNIMTFSPTFAVFTLGAASIVAFISLLISLFVFIANFFIGRTIPDLLSVIEFTAVASLTGFTSTYILFKLCEKLESYIYRNFRGDDAEGKILQLIEKNKKESIRYLEDLITEEPDKQIYGYAVDIKRMLTDSVNKDNIDKFITSFEKLYKLHELKPLNNNEEDYLEHEIGAINNIKKYL